MAETKIEWCESAVEACVHEGKRVHEPLAERPAFRKLVQPKVEILVALPAVAAAACRNDISGRRAPASRNRNQVIDGVGGGSAVHAKPTILRLKKIHSRRRDSVNAAPTLRGALLASEAIVGVARVAPRDISVSVRAATAGSDVGQPAQTVFAPSQPALSFGASLASAWPHACPRLAARETCRVLTVAARHVPAERCALFPLTAPRTPLVTHEDASRVVSGRQSGSSRRRLQCSGTTAHEVILP